MKPASNPPSDHPSLTITMRHTGETLTMFRQKNGSTRELHMRGSLPANQPGPPLHIHTGEDELTEILSGTMTASLEGSPISVEAGQSASFPRGSIHRWWNSSGEELIFRGVASPVVDLDRYLQGLFEVLNAGQPNHPPMFYLAHLFYRHRRTQIGLGIPPTIQRLLLPAMVAAGTLLGKYHGISWPGCPARCLGAPLRPRAGL